MITQLPACSTKGEFGFSSQLSLKKILVMIFFPVAIPYFMYHALVAFRKRFGLYSRPLEGKVRNLSLHKIQNKNFNIYIIKNFYP